MNTRSLTTTEFQLSKWMLLNSSVDAKTYLDQLEQAEATDWRCPCGCASFKFKIKGKSMASPGVHILGDFLFGMKMDLGVFIFESQGTLSGVEVWSAGDNDTPRELSDIADLVPMKASQIRKKQ